MLRVAVFSALAVSVLSIPTTFAKGRKKDGKDDVVGTQWAYTITRNGKEESGQFRCYQKELFKGKTKVGEVQPKDDDQSTLIFTDFGELNGKITIRRVKRKPPVWKGTLKRENGRSWDIVIRVKDR